MYKKRYKIIFILVLALTMSPIFIFPVISTHYHQLNHSPKVIDGILDLAGYDFIHKKAIPLDGKWQFYSDSWIISDGSDSGKKGLMVDVPMPWDFNETKRDTIKNQGIGSYRLLIKNAPADLHLVSYIPNSSSKYKVFMNGNLIANNGNMKETDNPKNEMQFPTINMPDNQTRKGITIPGGSIGELVIETDSPIAGGLYMTPILAEEREDHIRTDIRYMISAALIGILMITIGWIGCIILMKDKSLPSVALLLMDLLVLLCVFSSNEFFFIVQNLIPIRTYIYNNVLQTIILFLPVAFLFCTRQLVQMPVSKKLILYTAFYEFAFVPPILLSILMGRPHIQLAFTVISYIPFILIIKKLYQSMKKGTPYTLMVSFILMFILSSTIVTSLSASGLLLMNISLYPPVCFVISILLQLFMYIKKNNEMQNKVIEAENLRLRLKESEIDLMLSQIKPHFLYNTLIAIHMLCTQEPETAAETVMKFADFLRTNMKFISSHTPIPFEQELEHIKNYADIEKLRFQKRLNLRYDIETADFLVPPLSIQPLVENAIKYGACKNIGGGTVTLKTSETEHYYKVEIMDDGAGFDVKELQNKSLESHGIRNITLRLKEWMNAQVQISSCPEYGTHVIVLLPKEDAV